MQALRLDATGPASRGCAVALARALPGGRAGRDAGETEKIDVVTDGELVITTDDVPNGRFGFQWGLRVLMRGAGGRVSDHRTRPA